MDMSVLADQQERMCTDTGYCSEDLSRVMDNWYGYRDRLWKINVLQVRLDDDDIYIVQLEENSNLVKLS